MKNIVLDKIKYLDIKDTLLKTHHLTSVRIKRFPNDLLCVYITKCNKNGIWARNINENQDVLIFPSKKIKILKIGCKFVQSKKEFEQYKKDYYDMLNTLKGINKQKMYQDSYHHSRTLGNGEPIK